MWCVPTPRYELRVNLGNVPVMIEIDPTDNTSGAIAVGRFMYNWALLEAEINRSLGEALGLSPAEQFNVTGTMQFRSKINVLKTFANFQGA
jgi:hypothetical protein